jgi:methylthioribose-1-phosphate isomerase
MGPGEGWRANGFGRAARAPTGMANRPPETYAQPAFLSPLRQTMNASLSDSSGSPVPVTLRWAGGIDGSLFLIDQTKLPGELVELDCRTVPQVWEAIKSLRVRGAPAIGVSAAYGVVLATQAVVSATPEVFQAAVERAIDELATSRPTAVNLFWALERMRGVLRGHAGESSPQRAAALLAEAKSIELEDRAMCRAIGRNGAALLADQSGVLTHCNAVP